MKRITKISSLAAVVIAMGGGTAMAQSPADAVYNPNGGVEDVVASGTPAPTATPESGTLPETSTAKPEAPAQTTTPSQDTAAPASTPAATPAKTTEQASAGQLPFTGFEAGFVALAGLALLGGGLAMRRAARSDV